MGRLSSMAIEILPAPLQYRGLQQRQITGLNMRESYEDTIVLHKETKMELVWWVQNLDLNHGLSSAPQIVTQSNDSKTGWGEVRQGELSGGPWSKEEKGIISTFLNWKQLIWLYW